MKFVAPALLAALLAACASAPEPAPATTAADPCRNVDAPTGSNLKRRTDCASTAQAGTASDLRSAQELQQVTTPQRSLR